MTKLFESETRSGAWSQACEHLLQVDAEFNIVLTINSPLNDATDQPEVRSQIDRLLSYEGGFPLHTISETIFPAWEYRRHGPEGVYNIYPNESYPIIKKLPQNRWGTYAYRILRRTGAAGSTINPLESMIAKMKGELDSRGPKRACYELGIAEGEYDLPLYQTVDDRTSRRGGPCLSHLSFKLYKGTVLLTAIYRSHDYKAKVLGNLLGLARLQGFVADQVGAGVGDLVVHSTYATLNGGKTPVRKILAILKKFSITDTSRSQQIH